MCVCNNVNYCTYSKTKAVYFFCVKLFIFDQFFHNYIYKKDFIINIKQILQFVFKGIPTTTSVMGSSSDIQIFGFPQTCSEKDKFT